MKKISLHVATLVLHVATSPCIVETCKPRRCDVVEKKHQIALARRNVVETQPQDQLTKESMQRKTYLEEHIRVFGEDSRGELSSLLQESTE